MEKFVSKRVSAWISLIAENASNGNVPKWKDQQWKCLLVEKLRSGKTVQKINSGKRSLEKGLKVERSNSEWKVVSGKIVCGNIGIVKNKQQEV